MPNILLGQNVEMSNMNMNVGSAGDTESHTAEKSVKCIQGEAEIR